MKVALFGGRPVVHATRLLHAHMAIATVGMVAVVAFGRPALLGLIAPSLLLCVIALLGARRDDLKVEAEFDRDRGVEGDIAVLTVVATGKRLQIIDVEVTLPDALRSVAASRRVDLIGAAATDPDGRSRHVTTFDIELADWGISSPEKIEVRTSAWFGLVVTRRSYDCQCRIQVHLPDPRTRSLIEPSRFLGVVGNHASRDLGDGCELADVRPYRPGDRLRDINWRISARSDEPWITQRHPDRSATLVIVVNVVRDVGVGDLTSYRRSARLAVALAQSHLRVNDEVGLILMGARHRWIEPRAGRLQLQRITEAMLEVKSDAPAGTPVRLKARVPRDAQVVFISNLESNAFVGHVESLMARGNQVGVVDPEVATVSAEDWRAAQRAIRPDWLVATGFISDRSRTRVNAARLAAIERAQLHEQLRTRGLRVVDWRVDEPVESVVLALQSWRKARTLVGRS